jgi:hypothetical protein
MGKKSPQGAKKASVGSNRCLYLFAPLNTVILPVIAKVYK